ncbi:hypothetical protein [Sphingomonas sp.]|uniref:hypothetical protein n=1 Tax=Sphingomonas sp. TaxID=28214 RepID=UPI0035BBF1AF
MTADREACSMIVIDKCRSLNRRMAEQQARIGASPDDIAIAAIYSAIDVAQRHAGGTVAAIAWARRALDVMEDGVPLQADTVQ